MSLPFLMAETVDGVWRPGIGDPTPMGWITVVAYGAAAVVLMHAWRADRRAERAGQPACPRLWLALAALFVVLGVNKQLDLQSFVTAVGRRMALEGGWYNDRRRVQRAFILGVMVAAAVLALGLAWLVRRHLGRAAPALLGLVVLLAFVVIRAASFHKMDRWLGSAVLGLRWNNLLELGGIGLTAVGAWLGARPPPPSGPIPIRFPGATPRG